MAAGKDVLGYQKSLKESWISDHTWGLIAQRKLLQQKRQHESTSTSFYRDSIKKDREVKFSAQKDKREWFDRQTHEADDAAARNDMRQVYRITKKITGSTNGISGPIKPKDGSLISKEENKLERWAERFKYILDRPALNTPAHTDNSRNVLPIDTKEFMEDEARKAIATLKTNKSHGMDGITAGMTKACGEIIVQLEVVFCLGFPV